MLLSDQNRLDEARKVYDEALACYRKLAEKNPDVYLPYVAGIINNLGALLRDQNRLDEATKAFDEALAAYRQLAEKNPDSYLPDVAKTLNNLGVLLRDQKRLEEARKAYGEALAIERQLAEKTPTSTYPMSCCVSWWYHVAPLIRVQIRILNIKFVFAPIRACSTSLCC